MPLKRRNIPCPPHTNVGILDIVDYWMGKDFHQEMIVGMERRAQLYT
jgi:hypothetical protein